MRSLLRKLLRVLVLVALLAVGVDRWVEPPRAEAVDTSSARGRATAALPRARESVIEVGDGYRRAVANRLDALADVIPVEAIRRALGG